VSDDIFIKEEIQPAPENQNTFSLPDNVQKIDQLVSIIQTHKGDQQITVGEKTFSLNEEGIQQIRILLTK
jgi:hypothetical protein